MKAHLREVVLPAHLHDALASVCLPQDPDLVLCTVSLSFHGLWGWLNPKTNTPTGSNLRGHVTVVKIIKHTVTNTVIPVLLFILILRGFITGFGTASRFLIGGGVDLVKFDTVSY